MFLGKSARHGTVEVGKSADLVILNRNPLTDISATRSIRGVVLRGSYHSRSALDSILRATAEAVSKMPVPPSTRNPGDMAGEQH
jgi:predicted amidohydrolase YtcJ